MKVADFFALNPVFRSEEFGAFLKAHGSANLRTRDAHLRRYTLAGRLLRVKRGLYAVVPHGSKASKHQVDPYQVASQWGEGAVVAYHGALQFLGHAHSVWSHYPVLLPRRVPDLEFQGLTLRWAAVPASLLRKKLFDLEVKDHDQHGVTVRATTLERTLVDCLDRPDLGGDWEEVHNSFAGVAYLNFDHLVSYANKLGRAATAAKAGYFLEQNRKLWDVEDKVLNELRKLGPKVPTYLDTRAKGRSTKVKGWNLLVPDFIREKRWEEPKI